MGVQNVYIQAARRPRAVGLVLWLAPFAIAAPPRASAANAPPGAVAAFGRALGDGDLGRTGLVAGIPLDAVTWLGFGLAATAAAQRSRAAAGGKWDA